MLSREIVLEVKRLLDEGGLSQRRIAKLLKVSRGTVGAIASNKRGLHGREELPYVSLQLFAKLPSRCKKCGGYVYAPCLLCRAREYRRREEKIRRFEKVA
ncbi:MAG: helix-turn-helix domain-containing protein [Lacipirellulaceae bacterium]